MRANHDVRIPVDIFSGRSRPLQKRHWVLLTRIRDDMHLGPEAMKMIGEGIAKDITENRGNAWFAHEAQSDSGPSSATVSGGAGPTQKPQRHR